MYFNIHDPEAGTFAQMDALTLAQDFDLSEEEFERIIALQSHETVRIDTSLVITRLDGEEARPPTHAALLGFVEEIARLTKDGEDNGTEDGFCMECDDAVTTLCTLISGARALLGQPDDDD